MIRYNVHVFIGAAILAYAVWAIYAKQEVHEFISGVLVGWFGSKALGCCLVCNHTAKWDDVDYEPKRQ